VKSELMGIITCETRISVVSLMQALDEYPNPLKVKLEKLSWTDTSHVATMWTPQRLHNWSGWNTNIEKLQCHMEIIWQCSHLNPTKLHSHHTFRLDVERFRPNNTELIQRWYHLLASPPSRGPRKGQWITPGHDLDSVGINLVKFHHVYSLM